MIGQLKSVLRSIRWLLRSYRLRDSYLHESGFFRSLEKGRPATVSGAPAPWMNYSFIHFLAPRVSGLRIVEYGSGYSTAFWADRAAHVKAVEHNGEWFSQVKDQLRHHTNAEIVHISEKKNYVEYLKKENADIVIIDGIHRRSCMKAAVESLQDEAVVIVDDSNRTGISEEISNIKSEYEYKVIRISGMKARDTGVFETSILYKRKNVINL